MSANLNRNLDNKITLTNESTLWLTAGRSIKGDSVVWLQVIRGLEVLSRLIALKLTVIIGLALVTGACSDSPVPFDFTFDGSSSGAGYLMADRLTSNKMQGIKMYMDIENQSDLTYIRALASNGVLRACLESDKGPPTSVEVYEFKEPVPGFNWYHGNYEDYVARSWDAIKGDVLVEVNRNTGTGCKPFLTVTLSNMTFSSSGGNGKRCIKELTIPNVPLGEIRM